MQTQVDELIRRLEGCITAVDGDQELGGKIGPQALIYAAFLTDVKEGRIAHPSAAIKEGLRLVGEFCDVIEPDLFASQG